MKLAWLCYLHDEDEDHMPIMSFIGPTPIAYWHRSIASYQASFDFGEVA